METHGPEDTAEFPRQPLSQPALTMSSLVQVDVGAHSDRGKVRTENEDTFFVGRFDRRMTPLLTNLPEGECPAGAETGYAMLVADGMGGHAAGEVASRTTARVLLELVLETPDWIMRLDRAWAEEAFRRMERRLVQVQATLGERARADAALAGMGTTLTVAWSLGADLLLAHVGDSRAYLMRQGRLEQLTRDQTVVRQMVDAGELSEEEAARHRLRHVLTNALTAEGREVAIEFRRLRLADGDQVLLCSDGLTEMLPQEALAEALLGPGSAADACRALVDLALQAGGRDNVTVALARYRLPAA